MFPLKTTFLLSRNFLFFSFFCLSFTFTHGQTGVLGSLWDKPADKPPKTGEVSFNGQANTQKCKSATNLGEMVKQEDEQYVKKVCVTNPGQAKERCFMEVKGAKEPVENGDQLISTGQNSGGGGGDKGFKVLGKGKLVRTKSGFSWKDIPAKFDKSVEPEMQEKAEKSCCTRFGIFPDGKKLCIETIGSPVKQFGQLKGGNAGGNKSKPSQIPTGPEKNKSTLQTIREALSI